MTREIKFRGKRISDDKWVYGYFLISPNGACIYDPEIGDMPVIPETVGQFTGLCDKNGKEIYEGDWVKISSPDIEFKGYVDFRDGSFMVDAGYITGYRWIDYDVEVIGDIHTNPKLLEKP